jgi:hypothetical protein
MLPPAYRRQATVVGPDQVWNPGAGRAHSASPRLKAIGDTNTTRPPRPRRLTSVDRAPHSGAAGPSVRRLGKGSGALPR